MNTGRILSAFMIVVLTLGTGLQAEQMVGCMYNAPAMSMAADSGADAERNCDQTGKALVDTVNICHGFCMAPMISVEVAQPYAPAAIFAALHEAIEWRDTTSAPDPHPPKPTSHI
jgi:hypothetical protein